ncbi:hypothetical protein [Leptolyngbya sp. FACHB-671]|nr:hypothetical protein [Leptolyngbya sp. FACHB-671]
MSQLASRSKRSTDLLREELRLFSRGELFAVYSVTSGRPAL